MKDYELIDPNEDDVIPNRRYLNRDGTPRDPIPQPPSVGTAAVDLRVPVEPNRPAPESGAPSQPVTTIMLRNPFSTGFQFGFGFLTASIVLSLIGWLLWLAILGVVQGI